MTYLQLSGFKTKGEHLQNAPHWLLSHSVKTHLDLYFKHEHIQVSSAVGCFCRQGVGLALVYEQENPIEHHNHGTQVVVPSALGCIGHNLVQKEGDSLNCAVYQMQLSRSALAGCW